MSRCFYLLYAVICSVILSTIPYELNIVPSAKMKACLANIKEIEIAVRNYNKESSDKLSELNYTVLSNCFLGNKFPKCPSCGEYRFADDSYEQVYCTVHGTLENPVEFGKKHKIYIGDLYYGSSIIAFPILLFLLLCDLPKMRKICTGKNTVAAERLFLFWSFAVLAVTVLGGSSWITGFSYFKWM